MIEKNLKAILSDKMLNPEELPNFLTKKIIPLITTFMGKLYRY
jgi:hypothetical protein